MARKPANKPTAKAVDGSKSARTRERILDAAAKVLSRKGYAGTRLTDVAEEAQIQAPAIYYYYPSREDLIEEVMFTGIASITEHVQKVLDEVPDDASALERIDAAVEAHLRYELEISDYTSAAIRNQGQIPDELRTRYDAEVTKYGNVWRKLVQEAKDAGELRADLDPPAARMLVIGALNWTAEWWNPRRGSLSTVVQTARSMIRHGLGSPEYLESPEKPTSRSRKASQAGRKA